ncbi:MAG: MBL fold metallo-hydrolase [bacterium]|nr:MBL fold metallo-hydrolase [bacterium]
MLSDAGERIILDAGSGLRILGLELIKQGLPPATYNILVSHTHWDHIQGFPFFIPALIPGNKIIVWGFKNVEMSLEQIFRAQMNWVYFPISMKNMASSIEFREIEEDAFDIGNYHIESLYLNHPGLVLGYRISIDGHSFVYATDTEPYHRLFSPDNEGSSEASELDSKIGEHVNQLDRRLVDFSLNADLLIHDAQYLEHEYNTKIGWGHSTVEEAINVALASRIGKLVLFHYDPVRTDEELDAIMDTWAKKLAEKKQPLELIAAIEGNEIIL